MIKLEPRVPIPEARRRLGLQKVPTDQLARILPHLVFCPDAPDRLWVIRAVFAAWLDGLLSSTNRAITIEKVEEYTATPASQEQLCGLRAKWRAQITALAGNQGLSRGEVGTIFGAGPGSGLKHGQQRVETWARDPNHPLEFRPSGRITASDFLQLFVVQLPGGVRLTFDPPDE